MTGVKQVFRKISPYFFSIEKVFNTIRAELERGVPVDSVVLPYHSSGLLSIARNIYFLRSRLAQARIYHVVGDVHYAVLGLPGKRTILTIHDCVFLYATSGIKRAVLKWLFLDIPVRRAAVVTTISEFSKQEILRHTQCPPDKIVVIPNPVSTTIYYCRRAFNAENPAILFIGTTQNKNLERVAYALEALRCRLIIIGKLDDRQERLLRKYSINYSVLTGLSDEAMADQYAASDMVLFPSTFEGFGLPIVEGQKAGRIVVTSDIEPMKSVAGGGALLVDPFKVDSIRRGIIEATNNSVLREAIIEKGFNNIRNYSAGAVAAKYLQLYLKLGVVNQ